MRFTVASVFICVLFTIVAAREIKQVDVVEGLEHIFSISSSDIEECINKMKAVPSDFIALETSIGDRDKNAMNSTNVRRATCTLACCAQIQGSMSGAQLQLANIHSLIKEWVPPGDAINKVLKIVYTCYERVNGMTNECDVVYKFMECATMEA